jgi:hypothetical protein
VYSSHENAPPNTCNEDLHIEHDDTTVHLKPLMGVLRQRANPEIAGFQLTDFEQAPGYRDVRLGTALNGRVRLRS